MHVVAIYGWAEENPLLVQALADALGVIPYEARQRMIGGGPAVVGGFAEYAAAQGLKSRLDEAGFRTILIDTAGQLTERILARRFSFGGDTLTVESGEGLLKEIPYAAMQRFIAGTGTVSSSEVQTTTERKFSLGKTLLAGGLPMTKKVSREEVVTHEEHRKYLYLRAAGLPLVLFARHLLNYEGFGPAMELSQESNFNRLLSEVRRLAPAARYDDRLLNRQNLSRLLGPVRHPENDLDLAAEILLRADPAY